jgi:hypothetical protein
MHELLMTDCARRWSATRCPCARAHADVLSRRFVSIGQIVYALTNGYSAVPRLSSRSIACSCIGFLRARILEAE